MRAPSNLHLAGIFFLIAIAVFALIFTHKTKPAPTLTAPDNSVTQYIQAVEQQNEQARDEKDQADKLATLAKAKQDSPECQFWKQQKQNKSTNPRVGEKIAQYCELGLEQTAAEASL
jgi:hypothetical protein